MRKHPCALAMLLVLVSSAAASAEGDPKLKRVVPTDAVVFARSFSEDLQVGTFIFDNLLIDTEIGRGSLPSVADRKFTYVLQFDGTKPTTVVQHFRGFVSKSGSASAMLVIHSGGKTTLVDLDKAMEVTVSGERTVTFKEAEKLAKEQGFTEEEIPGTAHDYFVEIKTPVPAGKPLQTTVYLLVDRLPGDDGSGALLTVDTIDFGLTAPTAEEPTTKPEGKKKKNE